MDKQKLRDLRIFSKLHLEKLPFKINEKNFKTLGSAISLVFKELYSSQVESEKLKWCFSTIKRFKIFLEVFYSNEKGEEIYKEEIAKKLTEYSYKTIASIVDEGIEKGYYVTSQPDSTKVKDGKIKNIRPSKEVNIDFINWNFNRIIETNKLIKKYKS